MSGEGVLQVLDDGARLGEVEVPVPEHRHPRGQRALRRTPGAPVLALVHANDLHQVVEPLLLQGHERREGVGTDPERIHPQRELGHGPYRRTAARRGYHHSCTRSGLRHRWRSGGTPEESLSGGRRRGGSAAPGCRGDARRSPSRRRTVPRSAAPSGESTRTRPCVGVGLVATHQPELAPLPVRVLDLDPRSEHRPTVGTRAPAGPAPRARAGRPAPADARPRPGASSPSRLARSFTKQHGVPSGVRGRGPVGPRRSGAAGGAMSSSRVKALLTAPRTVGSGGRDVKRVRLSRPESR